MHPSRSSARGAGMAGRSPTLDSAHFLEINLISAQNLKPPSSSANLRRMKTYAVAWVDPSAKLRTLVDRVGGENPTWNEKFLFRVPAGFLASDSSSAIHIEIYVAGLLVDSLVGTVCFLIGNQRLLSSPPGVPSFAAVGIRRPSGRFHGVLNIGSALLPVRHVSALAAEALVRSGAEAIGYRDLMGENPKIRRRRPSATDESASKWGDSVKNSPGALKEWNGERWTAAKVVVGSSDGGGVLCGLGFPRKIHLSPSDQNFQRSAGSDDGNN